MSDDRRPFVVVLLGSALAVAGVVHLWLLPRYLPNEPVSAGLALIAGWASVTLLCYAVGRLRSAPRELPNMRFADVGIALLLVSLVVALALDAVGLATEATATVYAAPALGVYAGLALIGWSIGRRTEAINEIVR